MNILKLIMPKEKPPKRESDDLPRYDISCDFDGVIHAYSKGWADGSIYDVPMLGAKESVQAILEAGRTIVIQTTRRDLTAVTDWLNKWGFPALTVTNQKPLAKVYLDDRGLRFHDWEKAISDLSKLSPKKPHGTA